MKRTVIFGIMAAILGFTACSDDESAPTSPSSNMNIVDLRSAGKEIPNPTFNLSDCKVEGAEATLRSLRYVEPIPIYYMDYYAKVDWNSFIKNPENRYAANDKQSMIQDFDNMIYSYPPKEAFSHPKGACSGFVCFNPEGGLLFGRNYDGNKSPLVVLFNKAVNAGEHKSVMMTELSMGQAFFNLDYHGDSCLLENDRNLNVLLRQPLSIMDGMNDVGLCLASYQLPCFQEGADSEDDGPCNIERPKSVDQNSGKRQINQLILHRNILTECTTVDDVVAMMKKHDYTTIFAELNIHWYIADAQNNWLTLEFWKGNDGRDSLYVLNENDRYDASYQPVGYIPFEYRGIENYYCNAEVAGSFIYDYWQYSYTTKVRISSMMSHYMPIMTDEEALRCLQYGNYNIEVPNKKTDWSCVYNPRKKTVLFNMRNDLSNVYSIDLNKDL